MSDPALDAGSSRVLEHPASSGRPVLPAGDALSVETATAAELQRSGRIETPLGQSALVLARRIDFNVGETGTAMANMVREYRAALSEALADAERAADPLDELRARRERKLSG